MAETNHMRDIFIDKVVLNMGIGPNEEMFQNAKLLLEKLTSRTPIATLSKRRKPDLKLRKGQIIGAMVTLRNKGAEDILRRSIEANDGVLKSSSISNNSVSFGVKEYIYYAGVKYDPKVGMLGLNVNVSFSRPGRRIEERRRRRSSVGIRHKKISNEEIAAYLEKNFGAKVTEER